jgi:hypothetical protein
MTLQSMTNIATLTRNFNIANNASGKTDPVSLALASAAKRTGVQIAQTEAQLSSYGQIKSRFASLQTTGKALTTLAKNAPSADVINAAQGFVNAYNTTNSAIATAVTGNGKSAGVLANENPARVTGGDLRRVVTSAASNADLSKIGISVNQNGALSIDSKVLASALQSNPDAVKATLSALGGQANSTATTELSGSGAVGKAVSALGTRATSLATQQSQEQRIATAAQATIQQSANQIASFSGNSTAIGSYLNIFSL